MHFVVFSYLRYVNHVYLIMILISFFVGTGISFWMNIKQGVERKIAVLLVLAQFLLGQAGGYAAFIISEKVDPFVMLISYDERLVLCSLGGLAGMYLSNFVVAKITQKPYYWKIFSQDCTLVLPLIDSISKIGCHFAGRCVGIPYNGWVTVRYVKSDVTGDYTPELFPIQLTETVVFACIFILGAILFKLHVKDASFGVFVLSDAANFLLNFLRESHTEDILSFTQVLCALLLICVCVVYVIKGFVQLFPDKQNDG